jgi:hypothetical protein
MQKYNNICKPVIIRRQHPSTLLHINTDINISWTTSLGQFYYVLSPSNRTIYTVIGDIVPNTDMNKYKINSKDIEHIDISVLNVSQNDSGIYQSVS